MAEDQEAGPEAQGLGLLGQRKGKWEDDASLF